jgi:hypothetical protein
MHTFAKAQFVAAAANAATVMSSSARVIKFVHLSIAFWGMAALPMPKSR